MGHLRTHMKLVVCLAGFFIASISFAEESVEVVAAEGGVTVGNILGESTKPVKIKSILPGQNILTTGPSARAVVRVGDSGYIVVGKNSQVEINKSKNDAGFFRQISGIVYYAFNSLKGKQRRIEVKTSTATIGIRGTRFLVTDIPERNEIGMRKGLVNVASPEGEFELHKKAEQDEFEAYKQEAEVAIATKKREFEEYKASTQQEFIEYKREFGLEANRMASFDGKKVLDRPLSGEMIKDMESFESYADKWIKEVRD